MEEREQDKGHGMNATEHLEQVMTENIRRQLKEQKKKQTELAEALEMPRQTVSKLLAGTRTITAAELKRISEFLGVPMESLMEEEGEDSTAGFPEGYLRQAASREAQEGIRAALAIMELYPKEKPGAR